MFSRENLKKNRTKEMEGPSVIETSMSPPRGQLNSPYKPSIVSGISIVSPMSFIKDSFFAKT
jgi:hypothetical protein